MSHDQLVKLVEVEPTEEEEFAELVRRWDEEARRSFWEEVAYIQEKYHRSRAGKVRLLYQTHGVKLRIRRMISIPKKYKEA